MLLVLAICVKQSSRFEYGVPVSPWGCVPKRRYRSSQTDGTYKTVRVESGIWFIVWAVLLRRWTAKHASNHFMVTARNMARNVSVYSRMTGDEQQFKDIMLPGWFCNLYLASCADNMGRSKQSVMGIKRIQAKVRLVKITIYQLTAERLFIQWLRILTAGVKSKTATLGVEKCTPRKRVNWTLEELPKLNHERIQEPFFLTGMQNNCV